MKKEYNIIIEQDSEGFYIGYVPEIKGCHSQAKSIDVLMKRMEEVIALCIEVQGEKVSKTNFVGFQRLKVG
ncbi:MAG TPA: type II toxin-antitoxin system HicB family antitoxin [Ignavibacteria bacterium]